MGDQRYTRADVAGRNGQNGAPLWMVIKDVVYDVSAFLQEHPGGDSPLKEQAGKDATKEFESVGHSDDARDIMKKYKIGVIVEEEKHYDSNGKKKRVVAAQTESESRSCLNIISCGLIG